MGNTEYANAYRNIDFRKHPERYVVGKGEQGVLIAEPYRTEIIPYWRFATPEEAENSAKQILAMFYEYKKTQDFVGMDMARKFLQMGFTRSRRYANHPSGKKYRGSKVLPQASDALTSPKAVSAHIFKQAYDIARTDPEYLHLKEVHIGKHK